MLHFNSVKLHFSWIELQFNICLWFPVPGSRFPGTGFQPNEIRLYISAQTFRHICILHIPTFPALSDDCPPPRPFVFHLSHFTQSPGHPVTLSHPPGAPLSTLHRSSIINHPFLHATCTPCPMPHGLFSKHCQVSHSASLPTDSDRFYRLKLFFNFSV